MIFFIFDETSIAFDIATSEQYENSSKITSHPIENGSSITDHVNIENVKFSFDTFISSTPIREVLFDGVSYGEKSSKSLRSESVYLQTKQYEISVAKPPPQQNLSGLLSLLGGGNNVTIKGSQIAKRDLNSSVTVLQFPDGFDLRKLYFSALEKLRQDRTLFRVVTPLIDLENCVLSSFKTDVNLDTGNKAANISISVEQIQIVSTKTVTAPKPTEKRASKKTDQGKQGSTTGTPTPALDATSILYNFGLAPKKASTPAEPKVP